MTVVPIRAAEEPLPTPGNHEAEQQLTGTVILNPSSLARIPEMRPEYITVAKYRHAFAAAWHLHAIGDDVTPLTIAEELKRRGKLDLVGGHAGLMSITVPTPDPMIEQAGRIVIDAYRKRVQRDGMRRLVDSIERGNPTSDETTAELHRLADLTDIPVPDSPIKNRESGRSVIRAWEQPEPGPAETVVAGLVPSGHVTNLFGDGGTGKSYLLIYIACCVVLGRELFGHGTTKTNVVIFDFELSESEFIRRAYRVARGMGLSSIPENLFYVECDTPLTEASMFTRAKEIVRDTQARLVGIDSVAPASSASDQVAPGEIVPFMQQIRQLGSVLLVDHVVKPIAGQASAPPSRAYGSTFKHNLVRSSLRLERGEAGGGRLSQIKHNFGPLADPITFAMVHTFDSVRFDTIDVGDERLAGLVERSRTVPERIVDELREFGEDGASAARLAELFGCSKKTVSNQLSQLRQRRLVEPGVFGHWRVPDLPGKVPGNGGAV